MAATRYVKEDMGDILDVSKEVFENVINLISRWFLPNIFKIFEG